MRYTLTYSIDFRKRKTRNKKRLEVATNEVSAGSGVSAVLFVDLEACNLLGQGAFTTHPRSRAQRTRLRRRVSTAETWDASSSKHSKRVQPAFWRPHANHVVTNGIQASVHCRAPSPPNSTTACMSRNCRTRASRSAYPRLSSDAGWVRFADSGAVVKTFTPALCVCLLVCLLVEGASPRPTDWPKRQRNSLSCTGWSSGRQHQTVAHHGILCSMDTTSR